MIPKSMYLAVVAVAGLSCVSLFGQQKGTGDQPTATHWQFSATQMTQSVDASKIDGDFYRSVPLSKGFVEGMENRVLGAPSYFTSDGVVVSSILQPPITPETDATFHIEYAKVDTFKFPQDPQDVVPTTENTGVIRYRLNNCQVSLLEWPKR